HALPDRRLLGPELRGRALSQLVACGPYHPAARRTLATGGFRRRRPVGSASVGRGPVSVVVAGVVLEAGVLPDEGQPGRVDRAVALLADDDLGDALLVGIGVVDLVAINEHDDVGILLDRARFAQVGHDRPLVGSLLE